MSPFSQQMPLSEQLAKRLNNVLAEIDKTDDSTFAASNAENLTAEYIRRATIQQLGITPEEKFIISIKDGKFPSHDGNFYNCKDVEINIPFSGEFELLSYGPSSFKMVSPQSLGRSRDGITLTLKITNPNPEAIKAAIDREVDLIVWYINASNSDIREHNGKAESIIRAKVERKINDAKSIISGLENLGIPYKPKQS